MAITQDVKGSLMQVPMLDLKAQFAAIKDEIMQAVNEVCESQYMCLGPKVAEFEKNGAQYCQSKHAIGVSSGSDALILSLMAIGIEHGDEVIRETARIILNAVHELGNREDFVGHIGGDDFVFLTTINLSETICNSIIDDFDRIAPSFYNQEDRERGYTIGKDRQGTEMQIKLLSVSIGIVTNEYRQINHVVEIGEIGAELKKLAKATEGSNFVKDSRKRE